MLKDYRPLLYVIVPCLVFWTYLFFSATMTISCDAEQYQVLGARLASEGFKSYLAQGPTREPLYPLMISFSMTLSKIVSIPYQKAQMLLQILVMSLSVTGLYFLLLKIGVRSWLSACVCLYFGLSPAMVNSMLSLYSEILTYPLVIGLCFFAFSARNALVNAERIRALYFASALGITAFLLTLVKAIFEPVFYLWIMAFTLTVFGQKMIIKWRLALIFLAIALVPFATALHIYKTMNLTAHGEYVLANRGPWALYGNTFRRTVAITPSQGAAAVAMVPGWGVCEKFFARGECKRWSFEIADEIGLSVREHLEEKEKNTLARGDYVETASATMLKNSLGMISERPVQYGFLSFLESLKMFFWESMRIGFVDYPEALIKIHSSDGLNYLLRLTMAVVSFLAVVYGLRIRGDVFPLALLAVLYIAAHAPFFVLSRYAFPLVPVYLVLAGLLLEDRLKRARTSS